VEEKLPETPEKETEETSSCGWQHEYPDAEFEVGPRVCLKCGHVEY